MVEMKDLLVVTEEEKKAILKHYNLTEESLEEDVQAIKEWIRKNSHLPQDDFDHKLRVMLLNSKMSIEKTKQCMEGYYKVRAIHSDFFDRMIPNSDMYKQAKRLTCSVIIPKLAPNLSRITIGKAVDPNAEAEDGLVYYIIPLMIAELAVLHDYHLNNIIIIDMEGYTLRNFLKFTPSQNQKLINILNSVNMRLQEVHVINAPPVVDKIMSILKNLLPTKIIDKIKIHTELEGLYKDVPRDCLPSNYGGTLRSMEEMYEDWCKMVEANEDLYKKLLTLKSTKEYKVENREVFGMGSDGSFKKLAID